MHFFSFFLILFVHFFSFSIPQPSRLAIWSPYCPVKETRGSWVSMICYRSHCQQMTLGSWILNAKFPFNPSCSLLPIHTTSFSVSELLHTLILPLLASATYLLTDYPSFCTVWKRIGLCNEASVPFFVNKGWCGGYVTLRRDVELWLK